LELYKYILTLSLFISFGALILRRRDAMPYFTLFLFISVVFEFFVETYIEHIYINNFVAYAIFGSFTVSYYLFLYLREIFKDRRTTFLLITLYLVFCTVNLFVIQGFDAFNNISYNLGMMAVVISIFVYFRKILVRLTYFKLASIPLFWLSVGIIMFYSSAFPVLTFTNFLIRLEMNLASAMYDLVQIGNVFLSLSFICVVLCPILITK
jgi:hypothetical protein